MGRLATRILLESIEKPRATTQFNLEGELILKKPFSLL